MSLGSSEFGFYSPVIESYIQNNSSSLCYQVCKLRREKFLSNDFVLCFHGLPEENKKIIQQLEFEDESVWHTATHLPRGEKPCWKPEANTTEPTKTLYDHDCQRCNCSNQHHYWSDGKKTSNKGGGGDTETESAVSELPKTAQGEVQRRRAADLRRTSAISAP